MDDTAPTKPTPEQIAHKVLTSRSFRLFRPSPHPLHPRQLQLPDDFFDPTPEDLANASQAISNKVKNLTDSPFKTRQMRNLETRQRMSRFPNLLIRLIFPDRVALQGVFQPTNTVRNMQRFVRASFKDPRNVRFHMFVVPPKTVLSELDKTLWSLGFAPAAIVHVHIDEGPQDSSLLLKAFVLDAMEDTPEKPDDTPPVVQPPAASNEGKQDKNMPPAEPKKKSIGKKIPKWFKK